MKRKSRIMTSLLSLLLIGSLILSAEIGEIALAQKPVPVKNADGTTTTPGIPNEKYGSKGTVDETTDARGRVTKRVWKDRRGNTMEVEKTKYGMGNEKEVTTTLYNPLPNGKTEVGRETVTKTDVVGNEILTETTIYENGKEITKTKTEIDRRGKKRTYRWDRAYGEWEEVDANGTPVISGQGGSSAAQGFAVAREASGGLDTTIFSTPRGKIRVNLPNDMAAGDTISGTVVAEPEGKNQNDRAQNEGELNGYVVELEKQQSSSIQRNITLAIPVAITTSTYMILKDKKGKEVARTPVPVARTTPPVEEFDLPTTGQQGRPVEVRGPLDGDSATTRISVGGNDLEILAESPRQVVARNPSGQPVGPSEIEVREKDQVVGGEFRTLGIQLSAPKLNLLRGEQTTLTVTVTGLEGLKESVPLELENKSSNVIQMSGGEVQRLTINSSQVQGGSYTTERPLTGVQPGAFSITGTVISSRQRPSSVKGADGGALTTGLGAQKAPGTPGYTICGAGCQLPATEQGSGRVRCITTNACKGRGTGCACHMFRRPIKSNKDYEHVENPEVYVDRDAGYDYVCRCVK